MAHTRVVRGDVVERRDVVECRDVDERNNSVERNDFVARTDDVGCDARSTESRGPQTPSVLILGGTRDGFDLAVALLARESAARAPRAPARIVSSLAGRTSRPLMPPGETRVGGFGGVDGLVGYLRRERIDAVIDATHPFAARMSENAARACTLASVPLVALQRPGWTPRAGDRWYRVSDFATAAVRARELGRRILLTVGRRELAPFTAIVDRWFLVRSIDAPSEPLPPQHEVVLARGPFAFEEELALFRAHEIDVIVTKDSGGDATSAKLEAARALGIPVVVIDRPQATGAPIVANLEAALAWLDALPTSKANTR